MLQEMINREKQAKLDFLTEQNKERVAHLRTLEKGIEQLNNLSDGILRLELVSTKDRDFFRFEKQGALSSACVSINNFDFDKDDNLESLYVSGLAIFPLMGRKVSVKEFFQTIAKYL
jgi:hypothetical protein